MGLEILHTTWSATPTMVPPTRAIVVALLLIAQAVLAVPSPSVVCYTCDQSKLIYLGGEHNILLGPGPEAGYTDACVWHSRSLIVV